MRHGEKEAPCRACTDFKYWARSQKKSSSSGATQEGSGTAEAKRETTDLSHCPLDKDELGRSTWGFLHTMAAYYPDRASAQQETDMRGFIKAFAQFYPCEPCAKELREDVKKHPPVTNGRSELSRWLCDRHNSVNERLGKPLFDCTLLDERWRDGWKDGSCD